MATKTFEELKQLAIQIRDEKTNKQNTATRIGTQMLEHLDKLEQDYYDKTATDEELKERDEKLTEQERQYIPEKSIGNISDISYRYSFDGMYVQYTTDNMIPDDDTFGGFIFSVEPNKQYYINGFSPVSNRVYCFSNYPKLGSSDGNTGYLTIENNKFVTKDNTRYVCIAVQKSSHTFVDNYLFSEDYIRRKSLLKANIIKINANKLYSNYNTGEAKPNDNTFCGDVIEVDEEKRYTLLGQKTVSEKILCYSTYPKLGSSDGFLGDANPIVKSSFTYSLLEGTKYITLSFNQSDDLSNAYIADNVYINELQNNILQNANLRGGVITNKKLSLTKDNIVIRNNVIVGDIQTIDERYNGTLIQVNPQALYKIDFVPFNVACFSVVNYGTSDGFLGNAILDGDYLITLPSTNYILVTIKEDEFNNNLSIEELSGKLLLTTFTNFTKQLFLFEYQVKIGDTFLLELETPNKTSNEVQLGSSTGTEWVESKRYDASNNYFSYAFTATKEANYLACALADWENNQNAKLNFYKISVNKEDYSNIPTGKNFLFLGHSQFGEDLNLSSQKNTPVDYLCKILLEKGNKAYNYAFGGTDWKTKISNGKNYPCVKERYIQCCDTDNKLVDTEIDAIFICTGENSEDYQLLDYDGAVLLAQSSNPEEDTKNGIIVSTLKYIISRSPQARIYLCKTFAFISTSGSSWNNPQYHINYRNAMKGYSDVLGLTLIDFMREANIHGYMENNESTRFYTTDSVHPYTQAGQKRISSVLLSHIINDFVE